MTKFKQVYICHYYGKDPETSFKEVARICKEIVENEPNVLPMGPQIYFNHFISENGYREYIMDMCLNMVVRCDELWVYGDEISSGMAEEISLALYKEIPVVYREIESTGQLTPDRVIDYTNMDDVLSNHGW